MAKRTGFFFNHNGGLGTNTLAKALSQFGPSCPKEMSPVEEPQKESIKSTWEA